MNLQHRGGGNALVGGLSNSTGETHDDLREDGVFLIPYDILRPRALRLRCDVVFAVFGYQGKYNEART